MTGMAPGSQGRGRRAWASKRSVPHRRGLVLTLLGALACGGDELPCSEDEVSIRAERLAWPEMVPAHYLVAFELIDRSPPLWVCRGVRSFVARGYETARQAVEAAILTEPPSCGEDEASVQRSWRMVGIAHTARANANPAGHLWSWPEVFDFLEIASSEWNTRDLPWGPCE